MSKTTLTQLILEKLAEVGTGTLDAVFPTTRADTRIWRNILGLDKHHTFSRRTFSSTLSRLKSKDLVKSAHKSGAVYWSITEKGEEKTIIPHLSVADIPAKDGVYRLAFFDVPEKEREKRNWIREMLVMCGYKKVQRSVWIGERALPEGFVKALKKLSLQHKIYIVQIKKNEDLSLYLKQ